MYHIIINITLNRQTINSIKPLGVYVYIYYVVIYVIITQKAHDIKHKKIVCEKDL